MQGVSNSKKKTVCRETVIITNQCVTFGDFVSYLKNVTRISRRKIGSITFMQINLALGTHYCC